MDESPENYSEWKKSQSKKITYCMFQFIEHSCNDVIAMKTGLVVLGVKDGREGL